MADDPSNLVLTDAGRAYLLAQRAANAKARIGFFRTGDSHLFIPNTGMTDIFGNLTFTGLSTDNVIWWNKYNENEVIVRFLVNMDKGDFLIGNAGIYSDTGVLLFIASFVYDHHKMHTQSVDQGMISAGGRWEFQVRIVMEDIFSLWDFSNLVERFATTETHVLADGPQYPFESFYTELRLNDSFLPTNREGYFYLSGDTSRRWYGCPLQMSEANVIVFGRYDLDGGDVGDSHTGIW